jgi:hypothetical protein
VSFSYIDDFGMWKRKGLSELFGLVVVCRGDDPIVCARTRLTLSTILIDILRVSLYLCTFFADSESEQDFFLF